MKQEALARIFEIQRAKDAGDAHGALMLSRARLARMKAMDQIEHGNEMETE
jgi:hypothetical protein